LHTQGWRFTFIFHGLVAYTFQFWDVETDFIWKGSFRYRHEKFNFELNVKLIRDVEGARKLQLDGILKSIKKQQKIYHVETL
jgi:hypothetical protein